MNKENINKRIQALESELAELKAELNKPEGFRFKYKNGETYLVSNTTTDSGYKGLDDSYYRNFRYRQTEANANEDFQLQKELMCIGALAEQIDSDYKSKINWNSLTWNYHIYFSILENKYFINNNIDSINLGVVYMPKDVAEKVCEILNNEEVEL